MNRTHYFNYVDEKLGVLAYRIKLRGRLNILDLHLHSENFYSHFLNQLYGWDFSNANPFKQNVEAIDLIDHTNKCVCQVSATNTKTKVESALGKDIIKKYPSYTFKFVSIAKDGADLRKMTFSNPHGIKFHPKTDIIDNKSLLDFILGADIDRQEEVYKFIRKELGNTLDVAKLDTNLAKVINILSKEDFTAVPKPAINSFEIERKIGHNNLQTTRKLIEDYAAFFIRVDYQYNALDKLGANKSLSVLQAIRKSYIEESSKSGANSEDLLFLLVIENVITKVLSSANYAEIPLDELDFCVSVLVVDAFVRCKIFNNPTNYNYASPGQHTSPKLGVL
jgi:hypothetical protein